MVEVSSSTKQLEHERSAAEAALAQRVREYAKERAQKVRLQQQIGALQKRLLQKQIHELQNHVLIGGRRIDKDAPAEGSTGEEAEAADEGADQRAALADAQLALAAERRRADKLESRVRSLTARVGELTEELTVSKEEAVRWKRAAEGATAGALREITSNAVAVESQERTAGRWARGEGQRSGGG